MPINRLTSADRLKQNPQFERDQTSQGKYHERKVEHRPIPTSHLLKPAPDDNIIDTPLAKQLLQACGEQEYNWYISLGSKVDQALQQEKLMPLTVINYQEITNGRLIRKKQKIIINYTYNYCMDCNNSIAEKEAAIELNFLKKIMIIENNFLDDYHIKDYSTPKSLILFYETFNRRILELKPSINTCRTLLEILTILKKNHCLFLSIGQQIDMLCAQDKKLNIIEKDLTHLMNIQLKCLNTCLQFLNVNCHYNEIKDLSTDITTLNVMVFILNNNQVISSDNPVSANIIKETDKLIEFLVPRILRFMDYNLISNFLPERMSELLNSIAMIIQHNIIYLNQLTPLINRLILQLETFNLHKTLDQTELSKLIKTLISLKQADHEDQVYSIQRINCVDKLMQILNGN